MNLVTITEAAKRAGVSRNAVAQQVRAGRLKGRKYRLYVQCVDLDEVLKLWPTPGPRKPGKPKAITPLPSTPPSSA